MSAELDSRAICPCGSGQIYGRCCRKRNIRYELNNRGIISQAIPLTSGLKEAVQEAFVEFKKVFGRKPGKKDRVLVGQYLFNEEHHWSMVIKTGQAANTPEELIFAWRRTDFILAEQNQHLVPEVRKEEWRDAIDEYFDLKDRGFDPFYIFSPLDPKQYELYKILKESISTIIIVASAAIHDRKRIRADSDFFQFFFVSRALCSLRTIREMYESRYDDDCLSILRGIYECYLRTKLLRLEPESAEKFVARIMRDLGRAMMFRDEKGRAHRNKIVMPPNNKIVDISLSNYDIVRRSDFKFEEAVYQELYSELSGFVHPDVLHFINHLATDGDVGLFRQNDPYRAIVFVLEDTAKSKEISRLQEQIYRAASNYEGTLSGCD
jgi:hypothetical protein